MVKWLKAAVRKTAIVGSIPTARSIYSGDGTAMGWSPHLQCGKQKGSYSLSSTNSGECGNDYMSVKQDVIAYFVAYFNLGECRMRLHGKSARLTSRGVGSTPTIRKDVAQ
jgi:hypothetical protein